MNILYWNVKGLKSNVRELINIFHKYSEVSGQVINNTKSRFYTGAMTGTRANMISNMLGFSVGRSLFSILDVPSFKESPR